MRRIPHVLLAARLLLGPILLIGGVRVWLGTTLVGILLLATLNDIFDGIIARRLGVATPSLCRADSFVDTVFYIFVGVLVVVRSLTVLQQYWFGLLVLVLLEIVRAFFYQYNFKRQAAYHMWSATVWGVTLFLGFSELFLTDQAGTLFVVASVSDEE